MKDAKPDKHTRLRESLYDAFERRFPASLQAQTKASFSLIDGVNHHARLLKPFPLRTLKATGASFSDLDGHDIIDLWQGHYANILGHNPEPVRNALRNMLDNGAGLQTGHLEKALTEYSEILLQDTGDERVRLTTAGTLATMYAMMLARGYTNRKLVVKVAGGWHGASPSALRGVRRSQNGYDHTDSHGVARRVDETTIVVPFNDCETLSQLFTTRGSEIAALICEPVLGSAGFIPATRQYLETARQVTTQHGALLILDEIITGYRYCIGGVQNLYGIHADLTTYGKIIGGGMPMAAITGRADIMELASVQNPRRVWVSGGTFSGHPMSIIAGTTMLSFLQTNAEQIYPRLARQTEVLRNRTENAFRQHGILAKCTAHSDGPVAGSLSSVYFPYDPDLVPGCAEEMLNPALCDVELREDLLRIGMLLNNVNLSHGMGSLSAAHKPHHIDQIVESYSAFAHTLSEYMHDRR